MAKFALEDLKARLAEKQHKLTPQRQTILKIFLEHPDRHLSAEEVHRLLRAEKSEIGLATVYRSLELMSELGILQRLEFGEGKSRYEINTAEGAAHHHHHLICTQCECISEFADDLLDNLERDILEKNGFEVSDHQVIFFGVCKKCREKAANAE